MLYTLSNSVAIKMTQNDKLKNFLKTFQFQSIDIKQSAVLCLPGQISGYPVILGTKYVLTNLTLLSVMTIRRLLRVLKACGNPT